MDDDGTLSSREVDLSQTPDAVQQAVASHLNGDKVQTIDENLDDDEVIVSDEFRAELLLLVLAAESRLDSRLGQRLFLL